MSLYLFYTMVQKSQKWPKTQIKGVLNGQTWFARPAGLQGYFFSLLWAGTFLSKKEINRPYFPRPRKYRRLFSEPTYWPRRSRGQYGEVNNQAGIFEAEGNKSLIPERLARSPLTCPSSRKVRDESVVSLCSERCRASTGSPWLSDPKWFHRLFSTCNRELADSPGG